MFKIKNVYRAFIGLAAFSASVAAVANGGGYGAIPIAVAPPEQPIYSGFVIGIQGGYAETHWDNVLDFLKVIPNTTDSDSGFAGRAYLGYDFNQYFGLETGYVYLPNATFNINSANFLPLSDGSLRTSGKITNYAIDLLAKLSVPLVDGFGLYAKAGGAYFHSKFSDGALILGDNNVGGFQTSANHIGPAFGVGAYYEIIPCLNMDLSWMHYSGDNQLYSGNGSPLIVNGVTGIFNKNYQPNPDLVLLGLSYKFPVNFS